jgi:beta-lactamase class D
MHSAIAVSTVWFYQEMARRIGEEQMSLHVREANYGNMDISSSLEGFWLGGGSLKISLNEQVGFLSQLFKNDLPFSSRAMNITKEIMTLKEHEGYLLAGKTGSCGGVGWFVGFLKQGSKTEVFAFNIKGDGASGAEAKRIALEYFKEK